MKRKKKIELLSQLAESITQDSAFIYTVFVDLCESTQYKQNCINQNQPDLNWIVRQLIFLQRSTIIIKNYRGIPVKTIGDELFAYFEATTDPGNIIKCAVEIIQSFENLKAYQGKSKIEAKISIDFGSTYNGTIINSDIYDPIGYPVDRCARLNKLAQNNEIIFSENFLAEIKKIKALRTFKSRYGYESLANDLKGIGKIKYFKIFAK